MAQYLNSSFKAGEQGKLQVDPEKTNAFLCPVFVDLESEAGSSAR